MRNEFPLERKQIADRRLLSLGVWQRRELQNKKAPAPTVKRHLIELIDFKLFILEEVLAENVRLLVDPLSETEESFVGQENAHCLEEKENSHEDEHSR